MIANYSVIMMIKQSDRKGIHSTFTSDYCITVIRIIELFFLLIIMVIYSSLASFLLDSFMHFNYEHKWYSIMQFSDPLKLQSIKSSPSLFSFLN